MLSSTVVLSGLSVRISGLRPKNREIDERQRQKAPFLFTLFLLTLLSDLSMSYPGQIHHPHTPGEPPNAWSIGGEGWVPDTLELVQAHWFVRHGERSREYLSVLLGG